MPFEPERGGWYRPLNPNEHSYTEGYGFSPRPPFLIERRMISRCSAATVLCLILYMFLLSFLTRFFNRALFALLPVHLYPQFSEAVTQLSLILAYSISLALPFLLYAMHCRIPASAALPTRPVPAGLIFAATLASLAVSVVALYASNSLYLILSAFGIRFYEPMTVLPSDVLGTILYVLYMTAIPAIFEEFTFRGVLMQSLRRFGDSFALLVSSIFFALVHISPISVVHAFLMGLIIGYFVLFTGSIHTGMIIHFVYNLMALVITQFNQLGYGTARLLFHIMQACFALPGLVAIIWLTRNYSNMFSLKNSTTINPSGEKLRCFFCTLPFFLFVITILIQAGGYLL